MEKDFDWGVFFEDAERFADFVNCEGFQGKEVVKASQVRDADPRLYMKPDQKDGSFKKERPGSGGRKSSGRGKEKKLTRIRDSVRKVVLGTNFVIVDVEEQEILDYSYPLRNMGYVYGEYERQADRIRDRNRRKARRGEDEGKEHRDDPGENSREDAETAGEFLYHFRREDRLQPTIVFLLYSGKEEWTGPTDIYGMLDMENIPQELKSRIQNHRINLVDIHRMTEEQLSAYRSDVGKVFRLIRYSGEKEQLSRLVETDEYYENMPQDAYSVAANYINAVELKNINRYRTETGGYRMCTAIRELIVDGRAEGERRLLVKQACRKLRRQKTQEEIAEELEEEPEVIRAILEAAKSCAPDYDEGRVYELYVGRNK